MTIGFVGQGFIGKAYADEFESRGFSVVRYATEAPYSKNKGEISDCDVVFIAVPTPTTPTGFNYQIIQDVLTLVGKGKIAVIKSTVLPGTTETLQTQYPDILLLHSPEFLVAKTAKNDAQKPLRNIVGYTEQSQSIANQILSLLPPAPYSCTVPVKEAELIKYIGNLFLTQKVIFANLMYDIAQNFNLNYETIMEAVAADPRIGPSHLAISHDGGRGAGGYCFIKDLAAFSEFYKQTLPNDISGIAIFKDLEKKNIELLLNSQKDLDLLKGVYGADVLNT